MKGFVMLASLALMVVTCRPAAAWDPDAEDFVDWSPPIPMWEPEPMPVAPPPGIYLVTETYAGDVVTRSGPVTSYETQTVHETTGSYARVLETVGTGGSSAYDGSAFNGRAALTDGRAVAGTYYENYVRTDGGFVPVSVVFFQDDQEIARRSGSSAPPATTPAAAVPAPPSPASGPASGSVAPVVEPGGPAPTRPAPATPDPITPLPDRAIEVLRARRTALSFDGTDVRAWRLVSGDCVALGPTSGPSTQAFVGRWDRLAPPGSSWAMRFSIDYADGSSHELVVSVTVRAPGLVE